MADDLATLRNVTLRQLRVFATVARCLSFTAAARELHLTQPAVSMQVKELEQACGLPLFERLGKRVQLTEAGVELARGCAEIQLQLQQTQEVLDAMLGLKRGLLKLGAVSTAKYFTPSLLAEFSQRYPDITIRFTIGNREQMIRQMADNETDLLIMGRPPRELETIAASFAPHPLVVIAAPGHPLAQRTRIPLARLQQENFLIREPGSGTRAAMEKLCSANGIEYSASMEISSNETIKQAVIAGMGISLISAHTVGLELATGRLVVLNVSGLPIVRDWYVMHLKHKTLSPVAATFREFLLERGSAIIAETVGTAAVTSTKKPPANKRRRPQVPP